MKTKSALDAPFKCVKESSKEDFHLAADDGQPKCFGAIEGDFLIMKMCAQGFGMEHLFVYDLGKGKEVWKSEFGGDFSEIRTTPEGVRYQKPTGKRPTPANCSAMLDPNRNVTTTPGFGWLEAEDVTYRFADAKLVSTGAKSCFYLEDGG